MMSRHALTHHEDWGWRELHELEGSTWIRYRVGVDSERPGTSPLLWPGVLTGIALCAVGAALVWLCVMALLVLIDVVGGVL